MANEMTETGSRPRRARRLLTAFVSPGSYGLVLLMIMATYGIAASSSPTTWHGAAVLVAQAVTVWFALRTSRVRRSTLVAADVLLGLAILIAIGSGFGGDSRTTLGIVSMLSCMLYLVAPLAIVRHLVARDVVDTQTMLGAVAAYLMIGMFFAFTYRAIGIMQDAPFFGRNGDGTMPQILFFSFTTLTTTGYGNLVPAANPGQTFAVLEMLMGQLFLIAALGKVVSAWRPRRWAVAEPPTDAAPVDQPRAGSTTEQT